MGWRLAAGLITARAFFAIAVLALAIVDPRCANAGAAPTDSPLADGRRIYDFYCYQCHGYSGNALTLASTYLSPPPRDFTTADPETLTRERMLAAVTEGRAATAMVSFASVLTAAEREAVVDFIRSEFMQGKAPVRRYHTVENGWTDHERHAAAFPFATGAIPLAVPWEALTPEQQEGRRLYMRACVSCHDRGRMNAADPVWEPRALSYPRRHYSHASGDYDAVSGASTFALHDGAPAIGGLTARERLGGKLFQRNCAFCHGGDGSGRNWIGSFLEPHPRDLTGPRLAAMSDRRLQEVIGEGLPGTSMPAWGGVLHAGEIAAIGAYVRRLTAATRTAPSIGTVPNTSPTTETPPQWRRR